MKKIFTLFAALLVVAFSYAQLQDGSNAPDFNLYEINKTTGEMMTDHTINLYNMLNEYKTVYIDVSATTCGPCQSFHNGGTLESIYNNYGPNSSVNDSRVLFIEGANTGSSWASLNGTTSGTWDCTHVPYPVIPLRIAPNYPDNYSSFHSDYSIGYFPTIYMVCPNRMVFNLNNSSSNVATSFHNQIASKCPTWTNSKDALIETKNVMSSVAFCDIVPQILLQNVGTETLTSATFRVTCGSNQQQSTWTGNLAQFASEVVTLTPITPTQSGNQSVTVEIIEVNGAADQGTKYNSGTFSVKVQSQTPSGVPATQDFSSTNLGLWTKVDNTGGNFGVHSGTSSLRFRAWNASAGTTGELYAPLMDFTNVATPFLSFDVAHRRYQNNNEKLQVFVSGDCGVTWTTVWEKSGTELATVTSGSGEFTPTNAQWRNEVVDLTDFANHSNVIVKFVFTSDYGNNVYVDNIKITDGPVNVESVDESSLAIFPNPVYDVLIINYDKAISQIDVYDVNGKLVKTLTTVGSTVNVSDLSSGVYMLNMQTEDGLVVKKIVKE